MYLMEPTGADRRHMALSFRSARTGITYESLKRQAQEYYEAHIGSRQQFIAEFGKSYL